MKTKTTNLFTTANGTLFVVIPAGTTTARTKVEQVFIPGGETLGYIVERPVGYTVSVDVGDVMAADAVVNTRDEALTWLLELWEV